MTAATRPQVNITLKGKLEQRKRTPVTERKDDTALILRRLVGYMAGGERRPRFIRALAIRMAAVALLIAIPFFTGQAINVVSAPGGEVNMLFLWAGLALLAGVAFLILSVIAERVFADLATQGLANLQQDLFARMQSLSLSFFDRQPIGELMSRITNDTETVSLFYESAVSQMIRAIFQIGMILIVMVIINWQLTLVALLIVPIMLFLTTVIQRVSTPAFTKMQEELGKVTGFQEETISAQKVIISSRRQQWAIDSNDDLAGGVFDVATKAFFTSLLQFPLTQTLTMLQIVSVLVVGSLMALHGNIPFGVVISFVGYASLLSSPLSDIANLTATTLNAVAGGRRVFAIMDEQPTVVDAPDAKDFEFKGGHVEFENVDFSYVPGRKILKHNSFEALPGQTIGICGPTGAGKSTIINLLTRYYDIDSGVIRIDGQDISKLTQESLRKQIGVVLQEAFLFSDTVMNNLKYAREGATEEEVIAAAKQANAHDFIMNLPQGYDTMMTERGANLSQGQRQMITIARAMVADPKILVLDEATSNVDTRTEKLIQGGLQRLMAGKTSFMIAHRLSTIRNADKILVVNGGEIVEQGTHDELMALKGFYYKLYMSQFKGKGPAGEAGEVDASGFVST
ncbi:MAG TPA: ABC transporter ATP-binding protein [Chloroflexi bacterium]|nr:ABC transporter ATP-binding protein [Chloroflexota bacterium]